MLIYVWITCKLKNLRPRRKTLIWNQISGPFLLLQQVCKKTLPKKSPPFFSVVGKNKIVPNWHHMWGSVLWLDTLNGSPPPANTLHQLIFQRQYGEERSLQLPPLRTPQILQTPGSLKKLCVSTVPWRPLSHQTSPQWGGVREEREFIKEEEGVTDGVNTWSEVSEGTMEPCQNREVQTGVREILSNIKSWDNIKSLRTTVLQVML